MNPLTNMKNVKKLSERDLQSVGSKCSWHDQYKTSAWIFVGGLPYDLTEGDVICVFSQYGEIVNINLVRDRETGKSKGYTFICYEDQRSTNLAVDNFNGIKILGKTIRVDHTENYRAPKDSAKLDNVTRRLYHEGCAPRNPSSEPEIIEDSAVKSENILKEKKSYSDEKVEIKCEKETSTSISKEKRMKKKKRLPSPSSSSESESPSEEEKQPRRKKKKKASKTSSSDSDTTSSEEDEKRKKKKKHSKSTRIETSSLKEKRKRRKTKHSKPSSSESDSSSSSSSEEEKVSKKKRKKLSKQGSSEEESTSIRRKKHREPQKETSKYCSTTKMKCTPEPESARSVTLIAPEHCRSNYDTENGNRHDRYNQTNIHYREREWREPDIESYDSRDRRTVNNSDACRRYEHEHQSVNQRQYSDNSRSDRERHDSHRRVAPYNNEFRDRRDRY